MRRNIGHPLTPALPACSGASAAADALVRGIEALTMVGIGDKAVALGVGASAGASVAHADTTSVKMFILAKIIRRMVSVPATVLPIQRIRYITVQAGFEEFPARGSMRGRRHQTANPLNRCGRLREMRVGRFETCLRLSSS